MGRAEIHLTSSVTGLLIASVPLVGAVLYRLLGYDHFDRRRILGLLVGFAGVAVLVGVDLRGAEIGPVVEVLIPAVGYAIGPLIISRKLDDLPGHRCHHRVAGHRVGGLRPVRPDPPAHVDVASRWWRR